MRLRELWAAVILVAIAVGCPDQQDLVGVDSRRLTQVALNKTVRSLVWGEGDKAAITFEKSSKAYSTSAGRLMLAGILSWLERDFPAMAQAFADVVEADPSNAEAYAFLGVALARLHRVEEARAAVDRSLALASELPDAHYSLAEVLHAEGRKEESVRTLRGLIALEPAHEPAYLLLGDLLIGIGEYDEAAAVMQKAIRLFPPDFTVAQRRLGRALEMQGDLDGAKRAYAECLRVRPRWSTAIGDMGRVLLRSRDAAAAARVLRKGARLHPHNAVIRSLLGKALRGVGDYEGARSELEAALDLDPGNTAAKVDLGQLLFNHLRESRRGLDLLRAAARERPEAAYVHGALGLALGKAGMIDDAERELLEAVRLDPRDAGRHHNLGFVYFLRKSYPKALKHYRESVRLEPGSGAYQADLAAVLFLLGEHEDAWFCVHQAQKLGFRVNQELLNRLRAKMPEPRSVPEDLRRPE